jgi:hypothetical protein
MGSSSSSVLSPEDGSNAEQRQPPPAYAAIEPQKKKILYVNIDQGSTMRENDGPSSHMVNKRNRWFIVKYVNEATMRNWTKYKKFPIREVWLYSSPLEKRQSESHTFVVLRADHKYFLVEKMREDGCPILQFSFQRYCLETWNDDSAWRRTRCLVRDESHETVDTLFHILADELERCVVGEDLEEEDDDDDDFPFAQRVFNAFSVKQYCGDINAL